MSFRAVKATAPGKVILHGEHAVVYGKKAVATSIGLRTTVTLEPQANDCVTLSLLNFNASCQWKQDELQEDVRRLLDADLSCRTQQGSHLFAKFVDQCTNIPDVKSNLIKDAVSVFVFLLGRIMEDLKSLPSFTLEVDSCIPVGSGLGSSAAYSACLSAALLAAAGKIGPQKAMSDASPDCCVSGDVLTTPETVSLSSEDLALINKWSLEAEKLIHGKPSGIDNSICTYGGALTYQDGVIEHLSRIPKLKIILIDTKVARSTKNLISGLRERYQQFPTIYSPLFDAIGAITEESCVCLEKLYRAEAGAKETMTTDSDDLYRSLAKLIDLNQKLLVTLGVSHNSLDKLCSVTAKYGMHSKLTGAGGGGCAFTLVTPGICEKSLDDVTGELANQGFEVWETCLGDPGVTLMIA
ncbi:mevalonate kinase-like isoform X4 [Acropora millepora]|uniref:mevalonate kinase-like isoform X4 n=1 Tax=Acropora millepora TaxID=45264 RepID=UPI001CF3AF6A|nr:mevalonate kinase-like isoform X4 [Acropora millepora]